jgi:hypothetical protein
MLIDYLKSRGHRVIENEDIYGLDFFTVKDQKWFNWEVEVKANIAWTSVDDFPYETISFLGRKKRLETENFWYVIICSATKSAIFAPSTVIFKEEYKVVNKVRSEYRTGFDEFYRVPKELCIFRKIAV